MLILQNTGNLPGQIIRNFGVVTVCLTDQTGNEADGLLETAKGLLMQKAQELGANAIIDFQVDTVVARLATESVRHTFTLMGTAVLLQNPS